MKAVILFAIGGLALVHISGCAVTKPEPGDAEFVASEDVPIEVAVEARRIAEAQPKLASAMREVRVVYVGTELARRKTRESEDSPDQTYLVIHYRYDNDAAFHTLVSLAEGRVLEQRETPHAATALSAEELAAASALAMEDPRVREALGEDFERVEIEALVIRAASEDDPWFGRRVVRLLFKVGRDYRHRPIVVVDLTSGVVIIDEKKE